MNFAQPLVCRHLGQRSSERRLAVVDVSDRADVDVRFAAVEFFFGHVVYVLCFLLASLSSTLRLRVPLRRTGRARPASAGLRAAARLREAWAAKAGADDQNRTGDLVLTKDALCQLSYIGKLVLSSWCFVPGPSNVSSAFGGCPAVARASERRLERETGIEPATNSLEGCDSTTELLPPSRSRAPVRASARKPACSLSALQSRFGAQARLFFRPPTVLRPGLPPKLAQRAKVGGEGRTRTFEAARATDLQSAAFDRFATSPTVFFLESVLVPDTYLADRIHSSFGAGEGN